MADKPTHEVIHTSLYLRVDGVLQEMSVGDQLVLGKRQGANMAKRGFVKAIKPAKVVSKPTEKQSK